MPYHLYDVWYIYFYFYIIWLVDMVEKKNFFIRILIIKLYFIVC